MKAFLVYIYDTFIILQNRDESVCGCIRWISLQGKYFYREFHLM